MVIGDLNDFEDGAALTQNLVSAGVTLKNLWSEAPADNRYSFQFDGQLQTLDHIFVTDGLHAAVRDMRYVHFDNDYFERDETRHAAGVSDHDPPLVTIALPRRGPAHGDGRPPALAALRGAYCIGEGKQPWGGAAVRGRRPREVSYAGGCWVVGLLGHTSQHGGQRCWISVVLQQQSSTLRAGAARPGAAGGLFPLDAAVSAAKRAQHRRTIA